MDKVTLSILANIFRGSYKVGESTLFRLSINGQNFVSEGWFQRVQIARFIQGFAPTLKLIEAWDAAGISVPPHTDSGEQKNNEN